MKIKIISCVLVPSLLFFIGCYSPGKVTKEELKAKAIQADITVFTRDSSEYKFLKDNYSIQGDTLKGFGVRRGSTSSNVVLNASLSFADVDSIEAKEFNSTNTILLCSGIGLGTALIVYLILYSPEPDQAVQLSVVVVP